MRTTSRLGWAAALALSLLISSCGSRTSGDRADGVGARSDTSGTTTGDRGGAFDGAAGERYGAFGGPLPGAPRYEPRLVTSLEAAWTKRDRSYQPRTRHRLSDGSPKYTNRLFLESSPYLEQHAHNPVDWRPWGDEAFADAKRLNRPVFLSVGYSTCHWCHVMEEESFEDEEIARYMNENYIAIKVDREERPDVDAVYMAAVQMIGGRGGWPMSVWLTPDRKPYYGGTYFPPRDGDRGAPMGFRTILEKLKDAYVNRADEVMESASKVAEEIGNQLARLPAGTSLPDRDVLEEAFTQSRDRFDSTYGGMSGRPKFPSSLSVRYLLRYHRRTGDANALEMATLTLERMAAGGIYDHVGGGFHRYSTDERWLVPHFEKMLYDNALLVAAYLEGYQATGREDLARVAREVLRYVDRDMSAPEGGFYSASDADSPTPGGDREEGWFFTWTLDELGKALGRDRARIVETYYGVTKGGNFDGRNILYAPLSTEEASAKLGVSPAKLRAAVEESKSILLEVRSRRPPPHRDEKVLAAWNGLTISAFARASLVLGDAAYAQRAERAADFVLTRMREGGRLKRSYMDGRARFNAYLDDHAFLIAGLLDLYEATGRSRWLEEAIALDAILSKHFEDAEPGGYFMTADDHEELLAREKPAYDGAEPSGNSVEVLNLLRLAEFTTEDSYRARADRTLRTFAGRLKEAPLSLSEMLLAVEFRLDEPKGILIVAPRSRADAEPFLAKLRRAYAPNRILTVAVEGTDLDAQAKLVPLLQAKVARNGRATAYVCEAGLCELPTTDPDVFDRQIREVEPLGRERKSGSPPAPRGE